MINIDSALLKEMALSGAALLEKNKKKVDALNVFPVPDGDTGINMTLTILSAVREINGSPHPTAGSVAQAIARGTLKGARGNSGVILSQLFRGFARTIDNAPTVNTALFASAMAAGVDTAYRAVMKPREGTILTVARAMSDKALRLSKEGVADFIPFFEGVLQSGEETLQKTPEMLPVLKQAGVVDAGGVGLMFIYDGFLRALTGEAVTSDTEAFRYDYAAERELPAQAVSHAAADESDIRFVYCTEFFIKNANGGFEHEQSDALRAKLNRLGDSLIVVGDLELIKVHVHTNMPGRVLQFALQLGELSNIKIDNMREQHRSLLDEEQASAKEEPKPEIEEKEFAMVSVVAGEGIKALFQDLLVEHFIEGGQTMNPSTDDIFRAIEQTRAKNVFVLPNNPNIIMAATQARDLCARNVSVIPTKSIPQGLSAALAFNPLLSFEDNVKRMAEAAGSVKTGQVTYAVRDSVFDGRSISKGDIIGLSEGKIAFVGQDAERVCAELVDIIAGEDDEIVTLVYGADVTDAQAEEIVALLKERHPDYSIEAYKGGQPLYYYIISVE